MAHQLRLLMAPQQRRLPLALLFPEIVMDHISTIKLHQLRYNELDAPEAASIQEHLGSCERCRARYQAMRNERAAFELEAMPAAISALVEQQNRRPWWQRLLDGLRHPGAVGALAVAAAVLIFVSVDFGERTKGLHEIAASEVVVEGVGSLEEGDAINEGDLLQVRVPPGDWEQVWIGDAEGLIASFPMAPSKKWEFIPTAMEVDGEGSEEHIVIVLSNHPLTGDEAQAAADGEDLGGVVVQELVLPKEK